MTFIILLLLQGVMPHYSVSVDIYQLEYLYAHFTEDLEIPATITLDSLTSECTLSFRGGTSLQLPKKSWHIRLNEDEPFPGGSHILLNAQFRDPSLMRNTLGHLLTRELGYPAPECEFVTLSINGYNMGVYEHIERIDRRFYERIGLGFGPIFKSIDTLGRLVCQYAGRRGTYSFEPKIDSEPYTNQLLELIEACFRGDVSSLETGEVIAAFAVNTAISDRDGIIKNFYLHLYQGRWHYYPWDRDASFGNSWFGQYNPDWVENHSLNDIGYFGASRALLSQWENVQLLNSMIEESAEIMGDEFPAVVDSIRLLIRTELSEDPYYEYTVEQFDSLCAVLTADIQSRAVYLSQVSLEGTVPSIEEFEISSCLNLQDQIEVQLELEGGDPSGVWLLVSLDGADEEWHHMNPEGDGEWEYLLDIPPGTYRVNMAFGPRIKPCIVPVFYPSWSFRGYNARPVPGPGARISLAPLEPDLLVQGAPVWCGENLWVLPLTNTAGFTQDLSLCVFKAGNPSGTVFLPESVLVASGETIHLTNNAQKAEDYYAGQIFGDAGAPYPVNSQLILEDPSWHQIYTWTIGDGDSLPAPAARIIPSEVCCGRGSDWIEFYNPGGEPVDLSGWYLTDSESNVSFFTEGISISAGQFLIASENSAEVYPGGESVFLDFNLSAENDSICLFTNLGDPVFRFGWNEIWPCAQTGIMYLNSPRVSITSPFSWTPAEPPGTPGEPNPGWPACPSCTRISLVSQNPSSGRFSFFFESSSLPVEALLYDMCGRVVSHIDLPPSHEGTVTADFSGSLPSGVYIVYLRSSTGSASVRLTVLQEDK